MGLKVDRKCQSRIIVCKEGSRTGLKRIAGTFCVLAGGCFTPRIPETNKFFGFRFFYRLPDEHARQKT